MNILFDTWDWFNKQLDVETVWNQQCGILYCLCFKFALFFIVDIHNAHTKFGLTLLFPQEIEQAR